MENELSFVCKLSLQKLAMRRVAINLWNHSDILDLIKNLSNVSPDCCNYSEKWRETVENKVIHNLSKLKMPGLLTKQFLLVLTPIGLQIPRWRVLHEHYLKIGKPDLEKLRWTAAGTIDYPQTAKELVRCENLDIENRYRLACIYCLKDCIPLLWEELPVEVKEKFYNEGNISQFQVLSLPYYWPYILKGELAKLESLVLRHHRGGMSFNAIAMSHSAADGNRAATEFFYQLLLNGEENIFEVTRKALDSLTVRFFGNAILSKESRKIYFQSAEFPSGNFGNVLSYLLSLMNYEQQMQIIQSHPIILLRCFMEWPWQHIFLKIVDLIWGFISAEMYENLLKLIGHCLRYSNYSYPLFFLEWYTHSPIDFKRYFVAHECSAGVFFPIFFDNQDSEAIEVVFSNADASDRVRLVSSPHVLKLFHQRILKGRCKMVEVCLLEARLSKEDAKRVGEAFLKSLTGLCRRRRTGQIERSKPSLLIFLQLLDKTGNTSQLERISDDETLNKYKKFRTDE